MINTIEQARKVLGELGDPGAPDIWADMGQAFRQVGWAEDEIERAQRNRPKDADLLFHCFGLLTATMDLMSTEFVCRSHCRELLGRVVRGEDTRPGTWAEIVCVCAETSQLAPMNEAGFGTYARAWNSAGFPMAFPDQGDVLRHVEALRDSSIDTMTADLRRKLTRKDRVIGNPECKGLHHSEPAPACPFYHPQGEVRAA